MHDVRVEPLTLVFTRSPCNEGGVDAVCFTFSLQLFNIGSSHVVLHFLSVDESLKCNPSNERYRAALFCGTVYLTVQGIQLYQLIKF